MHAGSSIFGFLVDMDTGIEICFLSFEFLLKKLLNSLRLLKQIHL